MLGVSIKANLDEIIHGLDAMSARWRDMRPALREIGQLVRTSVVRNFEVGGRPEKWKPAQKDDGQTLIRSGRLRQSIAAAEPEVTATSVTVGTNVAYAAAHQFGSKPHTIKARRKKALFWPGAKHPVFSVLHPGTPARPFMVLQTSDERRILEKLTAYLEGAGP